MLCALFVGLALAASLQLSASLAALRAWVLKAPERLVCLVRGRASDFEIVGGLADAANSQQMLPNVLALVHVGGRLACASNHLKGGERNIWKSSESARAMC